ncbi:MAG: hypothetical protein JSV80_14570 [Acidobacteriota bacterium]|nr:MAG: hypothetical protein JSV80_14570 [Acidobacteriota bacterium]
MRSEKMLLLAFSMVVCAASVAVLAQAEQAEEEERPLFDTSKFRPSIAFLEAAPSTDAAFVTLTGVVFSRAPIDRVVVDERVALTRPAEPKDLLALDRAPEGATDAPFRTFFELPDVGLTRQGANDVEVRAVAADGRESHIHRVTVIRTASTAP